MVLSRVVILGVNLGSPKEFRWMHVSIVNRSVEIRTYVSISELHGLNHSMSAKMGAVFEEIIIVIENSEDVEYDSSTAGSDSARHVISPVFDLSGLSFDNGIVLEILHGQITSSIFDGFHHAFCNITLVKVGRVGLRNPLQSSGVSEPFDGVILMQGDSFRGKVGLPGFIIEPEIGDIISRLHVFLGPVYQELDIMPE